MGCHTVVPDCPVLPVVVSCLDLPKSLAQGQMGETYGIVDHMWLARSRAVSRRWKIAGVSELEALRRWAWVSVYRTLLLPVEIIKERKYWMGRVMS